MKKKYILIGILLIILAVGVVGYLQYNKPHIDYSKVEPAFKVNAETIIGEFNKNEKLATKKYIGKVIEIQGQPVGVSKLPDGGAYVMLYDNFMGIICQFDSNYVSNNKTYFIISQNNKTLSIKGRCDGFLTAVRLSKCSFINH